MSQVPKESVWQLGPEGCDFSNSVRAAEARRLVNKSPQGLEQPSFRDFHAGIRDVLHTTIRQQVLRDNDPDFFELQDALQQASQETDEERALVAEEVLAQRLDAHLTRVQKRMRRMRKPR